jgi:hypothetical protein
LGWNRGYGVSKSFEKTYRNCSKSTIRAIFRHFVGQLDESQSNNLPVQIQELDFATIEDCAANFGPESSSSEIDAELDPA